MEDTNLSEPSLVAKAINPYSTDPVTVPFKPPRNLSGDTSAAQIGTSSAFQLAGPWTRLSAQVVDWALLFICLLPGLLLTRALDNVAPLWADRVGGSVFVLGTLAIQALQAYRISTTGQSLGKRAFRIRIVTPDGDPPGFFDGVVLRQWIFVVLVPCLPISILCYLIDALLIFSESRQCLHDVIATTYVVRGNGGPVDGRTN